jgi:hypothetical protein
VRLFPMTNVLSTCSAALYSKLGSGTPRCMPLESGRWFGFARKPVYMLTEQALVAHTTCRVPGKRKK